MAIAPALFVAMSWAPSPLEQIEMLEQLRVLWYGEKIHVAVAEVVPGTGVDTPEDLRARARSCVILPILRQEGISGRFSILFTSILISPDDNPAQALIMKPVVFIGVIRNGTVAYRAEPPAG
jgi:hypothetical protein